MIALDLHAETRRLADFLCATPRGEMVTFNAMTNVIGRDIQAHRWILYRAMRVAERESGAAFACIRGQGYRRLNVNELAKVGETARSRIRSTARRGNRTITTALKGENGIEPGDLRKILAEQSVLGMLEYLTADKALPVIPETDTRPLPVAVVARDFLARMTKEK
jgi:hypothetical protein